MDGKTQRLDCEEGSRTESVVRKQMRSEARLNTSGPDLSGRLPPVRLHLLTVSQGST